MRWTWPATNILSEKWYKSNNSISDYVLEKPEHIWYANGLQLMRSRHQRTPMMYRSRLVVVESVHRCCSSFLARAKNSAFWIFKTRLKILHEHVTTTSPTFCYTSFRIPFYSSRAKKKKHFARTNSAHSWIALLTYEMTSKNKRGNTNFLNELKHYNYMLIRNPWRKIHFGVFIKILAIFEIWK